MCLYNIVLRMLDNVTGTTLSGQHLQDNNAMLSSWILQAGTKSISKMELMHFRAARQNTIVFPESKATAHICKCAMENNRGLELSFP